MIHKIKVWRRKQRIRGTYTDMEILLNSLDYALNEQGELNKEQRMIVLKQLVEKNHKRASDRTSMLKQELVEAEKVSDITNFISL